MHGPTRMDVSHIKIDLVRQARDRRQFRYDWTNTPSCRVTRYPSIDAGGSSRPPRAPPLNPFLISTARIEV